jgi:2-amino-4-hydroxy-6-hydroxymethyldihydropteridine diphosphokinase
LKRNDKQDQTKVLLSLGSNIGDKIDYIEKAINLLTQSGIFNIIQRSSYYFTEPYGISEQNWYANIVVEGYTELEANSFLQFCKSIEYMLGRKIRKRWTNREIDIDILFFGNSIIQTKELEIPHPQIQFRNFVLVPLNEIEPNFVHPVFNVTISELFSISKDKLQVIKKDDARRN